MIAEIGAFAAALALALSLLQGVLGAVGPPSEPRLGALRAHRLYCTGLPADENIPSTETFRKFATGQWPFPRVLKLLAEAGVRSTARARIDRPRLRSVFEEAIQRLESRLLKGHAKPSEIARRAYELYKLASNDDTKPSRRTFEKLLYGKAADPEISLLVETALAKNRKDETV